MGPLLESGGVALIVLVHVGQPQFPLAEQPENVETPDVPQCLESALHRSCAHLARAPGRQLQPGNPAPPDLHDVPIALRPLKDAHLVLLRDSINAAMSDSRHRRVCGASWMARCPTTS